MRASCPVQHRRRIDRLGRHRGQPQPGDASGTPTHTNGEIHIDPTQRVRINCEHIQMGGVHQQVFPGPRRMHLPVRQRRTCGDVSVALCAVGKKCQRWSLTGSASNASPFLCRISGVAGLRLFRNAVRSRMHRRRLLDHPSGTSREMSQRVPLRRITKSQNTPIRCTSCWILYARSRLCSGPTPPSSTTSTRGCV
jgi:hypothetical protein